MSVLAVASMIFALMYIGIDADEENPHLSPLGSLRKYQDPTHMLKYNGTVFLRQAPKGWGRDNAKCMKSNLLASGPGNVYNRTIEFYTLGMAASGPRYRYEYVVLNVSMRVMHKGEHTFIEAVEYSKGDTFPAKEKGTKKTKKTNLRQHKLHPEACKGQAYYTQMPSTQCR
uniref:Putative secreted protein n=1 Tax=Amblyomma triste TaxID=251400 RepID=A0A023G1D5_AMBTT